MDNDSLTEPAKLLLLASLLAKDRIISNNGKAFLKELVLRKDKRLVELLRKFESKETGDAEFLEGIHKLIDEETFDLYVQLFSDVSLEVGKTLSKSEREEKQLSDEKSLIYGEVDFHSFARILRKVGPFSDGVFYDLGSGTSKAVFVARLTQDFATCLGIEILEGLHQAAHGICERYNSSFRELLNSTQSQEVGVKLGSFLDYDWSDGDVVFANSTCFDDELMEAMSKAAEAMAPGSIFISFTKGLCSPKFEVLDKKRYKMSWGPATVFIHRRLNLDGTPVNAEKVTLDDDQESYFEYDDDDDDDDDNDDDDYEDGEEEESDEGTEYTDETATDNTDGTAETGDVEEEEDEEDGDATPKLHTGAIAGYPASRYAQDYRDFSSPQDTALMMRKMKHGP
mmetsp:Transcript_6864/g.9220  ORF Transcript_6864/g.9220 Transcript_6864/m.9220 type:complete len:397 (+) Transcript_6864:49-1239(+)